MTRADRSPIVVDTGVFGARLTPAGQDLAFQYRPLLAGRPAVLSYATVAELRFGATVAGWGARRMRRLEADLDTIPTVWPGPSLTAAYVALRVWCVRTGQGLVHKEHEADRWIAATAIWLDVPLVAHDGIFEGVDGLELLTRLWSRSEAPTSRTTSTSQYAARVGATSISDSARYWSGR